MKIAFEAQALFDQERTGIGWCSKELIDHLIEYPDFEYILNCFHCFRKGPREEREKILEKYREKGCKINYSKYIPARIYNHLERIIPLPYRLLFGTDADLTQFFNYTIPYGVAGKSMTIIHDMTFMVYPETIQKKTYNWLNSNIRKYCGRAAVILTVSEFSRQEIIKYLGIPADKIEVIYDGVDLDLFHPGYDPEQIDKTKEKYGINGDYILYLGTLEPRKNIETLVAAYADLKNSRENVPKLVLAGKKGWMYDSIFAGVEAAGLKQDVIFTDYVPEEDVPLLMSGAKMFVFPSLYEGFGMPPLEAMACGTPVITSDAASLPEVVGDAGLTFPVKDTKALTQNMERLLDNAKLCERLSEAGIERAGQFTWESSAKKLIGIYHRLEDSLE